MEHITQSIEETNLTSRKDTVHLFLPSVIELNILFQEDLRQ